MTAVKTRAIAAALAAFTLAGCAPSRGATETSPTPEPVPSAPSGPPAVRQPYPAADVKFMAAMIGHHAQAIEMAHLVPGRTENAALRTLAGRIINAQQDEIRVMQTWLRDRGEVVPEPDGHAHHDHGAGLMQGMLTPDQMAALAAARGADFDLLFLRSMIQHHRGAVAMVQELMGSRGAAQDDTVFKLAADVNVDQITEINRMEEMLLTLILERGSQ